MVLVLLLYFSLTYMRCIKKKQLVSNKVAQNQFMEGTGLDATGDCSCDLYSDPQRECNCTPPIGSKHLL